MRKRGPSSRAGLLRALLVAAAAGLVLGPAAARAQIDLGASHDTSQPIEITADNLEVEQDRQIATFTGNVDAVQGELVLKADRLVVHYRQDGETENNVSRIVAEGNVFLASPDSTAQGDRGVYDVDNDTMVLIGNVVLTRDENVIRGDRLTINLATGKSRMESRAAASGTSVPESDRVKALFVPKNKKSKKKK